MTGIERLRELVDGISPITALCGVTRSSYDRSHIETVGARLRDFLADIADQIEREQGERVSRVRVLAVVTKMERHVLGHEGIEDSPVARWARELREALGGDERDHADERDAIAWVREHGGLDNVKKLLDWVIGHCSTKQQLDFDFWLSGRVMHELGFDEDMADRDEVERRLLARLMPEGMEWLVEAWPRFEDGAPVRFGEEAMGFSHKPPFVVDHVTLFDGGEVTVCAEVDLDSGSVENFVRVLPGERVKRPTPKDSWERLEEDVANASCPDVYCANHHIDASDTSYEWAMARDIVRRARALAERERGE